MKGEAAVKNLINGNLRDAKASASRCNFKQLRAAAEEQGMADPEGAALYLKGQIDFQEHADRDFKAKEAAKNAVQGSER